MDSAIQNRLRVAVIDLKLGNLGSICAALEFLGAPFDVLQTPDGLKDATHIILPGVGSFDTAMINLRAHGLEAPIKHAVLEQKRPLLGICLGMQILCEASEEGKELGLALIPGKFRKIPNNGQFSLKVPHVGFSKIKASCDKGIFDSLPEDSYFYFTHSYALGSVPPDADYANCLYGQNFVAAFQQKQICGVQFHPEKSQYPGLLLIHNFLTKVQCQL